MIDDGTADNDLDTWRRSRTGPTYDEPGNCPKCDTDAPLMEYRGTEVTQLGHRYASLGTLLAVCQWCGFKWALIAKDEQ